ncbi:SigE family RNA polymerase sigma factor [Nocardioides bruguierae]|uniref:SigE family RNA polymerase sigma factor n=1 Tax=Nocardioides bruguierae TaxID=2945102 RepID=UPI0020226D86|nr:SigE family RNA polymerase sigma factor [Nocardioides bruguierae]MCL8024359.1 SigE family RNA polymerase sigma factor [Nocardioides bruguierae]
MRGSETPDSFTEFVVARREALLRTATMLTGDPHDAEDLVQVALARCVPRWSRIEDDPEPYVRTVLVRENVTRWRRRRWRETTVTTLPEPHAAPDHAGALGEVDALRRALAGLAPKQRAVVVLRYVEDLPEDEVAHLLGVRRGTVKSQAHDGLKRLRALLDQTGEKVSV